MASALLFERYDVTGVDHEAKNHANHTMVDRGLAGPLIS